MTMGELLERLSPDHPRYNEETLYLQSQNGNLYTGSEYEALREDVPREVSWCSEALGTTLHAFISLQTTRLMR